MNNIILNKNKTLTKTFNSDKILKEDYNLIKSDYNSINESLTHFSPKQKNIINNVIKDCYDNLKNLSK